MARTSHRQLFLFLIAIIVPSVLLVGVSLQIISQEEELAEKRRIEERQSEILPMLCRELNRQPVRRRNTVMLSEVFTEAVEVKR